MGKAQKSISIYDFFISLFSLPEGLPLEPLRTLVEFHAVQRVAEPITPLGQDTMKLVLTGGGRLFGLDYSLEERTAFLSATEKLVAAVRQLRGGHIKARMIRFAISRYRAIAGMREAPKFFAIRMMGIIRQELLSDGAAFYEGVAAPVRGQRTPSSATRFPPAWWRSPYEWSSTPTRRNWRPVKSWSAPALLFLTTGGLVMEVDRMMTHGSVSTCIRPPRGCKPVSACGWMGAQV